MPIIFASAMFWKRSVRPKGRTKKVVHTISNSAGSRKWVQKSSDVRPDFKLVSATEDFTTKKKLSVWKKTRPSAGTNLYFSQQILIFSVKILISSIVKPVLRKILIFREKTKIRIGTTVLKTVQKYRNFEF